MVKKNYLGGLKVLLSLLFGTLFAMSSTCYALTPSNEMNNDIATSLFDCIYNNLLYEDNSFPSTIQGYFNQFKQNVNINNFVTDWNNNINTSYYPNFEQIIVVLQGQNIFLVQNNNTIGNDLPHFALEYYMQDGSNYVYRDYYVNDSKNFTSGYFTKISWSSNGSYTWNSPVRQNATNAYTYAINQQIMIKAQPSINSSNSTINIPCVIGFTNNSILFNTTYVSNSYASRQGNFYWNINTIDYDFNPAPPEPEEPSGDSPSGDSGDSGGSGGGFIDYTNKLNDINNNISNSSNNIISNSNENTDKIINSISGETNKIINNITNTDTDVNVSGELSNMLSSTENIVDPTINFFSWLLDNIRSILNSTGDYDLNITLFDKTYTIRSDFFKLPDGDLKIFLQSAFLAWFGWRIIKKIRYIVYAIKCVNISSALNSVDFNPDIL